MIFQQLIENIPFIKSLGNLNTEVKNLRFNSKEVMPGDVFIALKGEVTDGHQYINPAIDNGATAIVVETAEAFEALSQKGNIIALYVKDTAIALSQMASNFYGNPSRQLKLVGITGTNGKTTSTTLLYHLAEAMGYPSALISTIQIKIHKETLPATHTTPDVLKINEVLAQAVKAGCEYAFMEVSSHGIAQKRISGLHFSVAGFTNITHDHLDYHKTFKNYLSIKKSFFDGLSKEAIAITNKDDKNGIVMLQNTAAQTKTYGLKNMADYRGKILEQSFSGMLLRFNEDEFYTPLVGRFNAYNLLLIYAVSQALNWDKTETLLTMSKLNNVSGRFQNYASALPIHIIVDYAHTPDALENVLNTIQALRTQNETLFCLVGCGGNRDKTKRPEMAKIATQYADLTILTSDNPRRENPETIIEEMQAGIEPWKSSKYLSIANRKEAIKTAIQMAKANDIVLIAGKGHETYQEINDIKHPFDDLEIAINLTQLLKK